MNYVTSNTIMTGERNYSPLKYKIGNPQIWVMPMVTWQVTLTKSVNITKPEFIHQCKRLLMLPYLFQEGVLKLN